MTLPPKLKQALAIWLIASLAIAIAGPFGTINMPFELRLPYWLGLMGFNTLKWSMWMRAGERWLCRTPRHHLLWTLAGGLVINLPLPIEVGVMNQLVGSDRTVPFWALYRASTTLCLVATLGIIVVGRLRHQEQQGPAPEMTGALAPATANPAETPALAAEAEPLDPPQGEATGGLLARAGLTDPSLILAVEAEDHYLRVHLADGRRPLVLYRLRDALAELAPLDGEQVHRGHWVAGQAVVGLERRDGRKWALRLKGELIVPVSATFLPAVRKRGWRELNPVTER